MGKAGPEGPSDGNHLKEILNRIGRLPAASDIWALRGELLAHPQADGKADLLQETACEFFLFVSELQSKLSARQYNELASRLDISAIGMLALQDVLVETKDLWQNLVLGGIGEGLMVLASRQYIKAWDEELRAVHRRAAWTLYGVLWRLSVEMQPELPGNERRILIEAMLGPSMEEDRTFEERNLVLLRLFQIVVLVLAAPFCNEE